MRLILHIGMHKTASTTIQRRLKANNPKLQNFGFRYAAKERKMLLKAARKQNFKPWRKLIRQAQTEGFTPIVSHEAFSHILCRSRSAKDSRCIGDWLLNKLNQVDVDVTVIGFVRDQPSYLNSHYTQHVKRFATAQSLEAYAAKAMKPSIGKRTCDPEQLFGWLEQHSSVHAVFFPYGRSITAPPSLEEGPKEPFDQLIHCLGIPKTVHFKPLANQNSQPGDLAIRTALQLNQELKREGVRLGKSAKRARTLLCQEAERRNWTKTPYMGVDPRLNRRIRAHFAAANDRFAKRIWGCPGDQIFSPAAAAESPVPNAAEQKAIDQATQRIRRRLIPRSQRIRAWLRQLGSAIGTKKERC
jgi:hypothetical protein